MTVSFCSRIATAVESAFRRTLAALAAASLPRQPFADIGRTVSEIDAIPLGAGQERHGITVDQFDLREVESDDTAFLQRGAKDIQAFSGDPTTDAKNDTLFNRKSVDSACHGRWPVARGRQWQTERHRECAESAAKPDGL
jgi:hypothetical protein